MNQNDRIFSIDVQSIDLREFNQKGRILDIGGGGEGIIGQLLDENVIAIDPRDDELEEAADGPLKIIMDASELKFLNNTFDGATSFFTFMYIEKQYHLRVFEEIYRVLKDNCYFTVWDADIPKFPGGTQDIFLVPLEVKLRNKKISTSYGILWNKAEQDMMYYIKLGEKAGFEVISQEITNQTFCLKYQKKLKIY